VADARLDVRYTTVSIIPTRGDIGEMATQALFPLEYQYGAIPIK